MKKTVIFFLALSMVIGVAGCGNKSSSGNKGNSASEDKKDIKTIAEKKTSTSSAPQFANVSVHDPSVIKVGDTFYVIGSHMASAKTNDLMKWTQITTGPQPGNKLVPNPREEMKEPLEWAKTDTFWAGDIIQLADGKFYMYYCTCIGNAPISALGVAVSDNIEGPYKNKQIILKSGMSGTSEDGTPYNATVHPNAIDPDTFFDKDGKLWMVYGSYSGGIFIMSMDPSTGLPYPGQGYGKKLLGGNHARIEGPYMLYSPDTDYYYLFLSYGGLDAKGGYNIRVARSKNPDGPFEDAAGHDMSKVRASAPFNDNSISNYGTKLIGNFQFVKTKDEPVGLANGYVSPGHNSAYYDEQTKKYYIIFHTRFPNTGEAHQVRVHQMFMNADGWPVIAPNRYAGETIEKYTTDDVIGDYKFVNHGKEITMVIKKSENITLSADGKVSGKQQGTWKLVGDNQIELTIKNVTYKGYFICQWDTSVNRYVMAFTALSDKGVAVWGNQRVTK